MSETKMMEQGPIHGSAACSCQCAAIWKLDESLIACLRTSEITARRSSRAQLLIADLVASFCRNEGVTAELRQLGVVPAALHDEVSRLTAQTIRHGPSESRIVLSDALNALLIACEESAAFVGSQVVTLHIVFATLVRNAMQDPAAQIFASHASALRPVSSPDQRAVAAVRHAAALPDAGVQSLQYTDYRTEREPSHSDTSPATTGYAQDVRTVSNRSRYGKNHRGDSLRPASLQQHSALSRLDCRSTQVSAHDGADRWRQDATSRGRGAYDRQCHHDRDPFGDDRAQGLLARPARDAEPRNDTASAHASAEKRFYLSLEDDLVEAPSIGPKTAARFAPFGVHTVADFLSIDIDDMVAKLNVRHITSTVLKDWQDQARMVCTVPWLRGTHAQLLVGADYRSADAVANADLGEVLAGILRFAATHQGERVLRTNPPPEREKVAAWIDHARHADLSRVA